MGFKDQMALMAAPIFLRLALSITFLWAGSGKLTQFFEVSGADAAYLANMNAIDLSQLAGAGGGGAAQSGSTPFLPPLAQNTAPTVRIFFASDFPTPVKARSMYRISLLLRNAAEPGNDDSGATKMRLWPTALAQGQWTRGLAITVAWTEAIGGLLVFVGLFTRLWSFLLAGTMMGAMWLTLIGPTIQSGKTRLGFLPADPSLFDVAAWTPWLFVFGTLMSCLALMCAGAGAWSLDAALAPAKPSPKPAAPKPVAP